MVGYKIAIASTVVAFSDVIAGLYAESSFLVTNFGVQNLVCSTSSESLGQVRMSTSSGQGQGHRRLEQ